MDEHALPTEDPSGNKLDWEETQDWTDMVEGEPVEHGHVAKQYKTWTCKNTGMTYRLERDNPDYTGPAPEPEDEED